MSSRITPTAPPMEQSGFYPDLSSFDANNLTEAERTLLGVPNNTTGAIPNDWEIIDMNELPPPVQRVANVATPRINNTTHLERRDYNHPSLHSDIGSDRLSAWFNQ